MIRIEAGDCLEVIPRLVAEGVVVDAVVTDPPCRRSAGSVAVTGEERMMHECPVCGGECDCDMEYGECSHECDEDDDEEGELIDV